MNRPRAFVRAVTLSLSLLAACALLFSLSYFTSQAGESHDRCLARQRLYDGELFLTSFFADEVHATPAQREHALADLRARLGPRPTC